jgi:hypothetical protein
MELIPMNLLPPQADDLVSHQLTGYFGAEKLLEAGTCSSLNLIQTHVNSSDDGCFSGYVQTH